MNTLEKAEIREITDSELDQVSGGVPLVAVAIIGFCAGYGAASLGYDVAEAYLRSR